MQHFYIFNRLQNEVNSPSLEQSQTIHQPEPPAFGLLCWLTVQLLEIENCREKELFAKHLVVKFSCLNGCCTISAWGHETVYLFHGREIERQIDNNRGCRGKKKEGREEDRYTTIPTHTIRINWYDSYRLVCNSRNHFVSHIPLSSQSAMRLDK